MTYWDKDTIQLVQNPNDKLKIDHSKWHKDKGNKLDPKKNIRVRRIITPKWCVWQIQDQGNGLEIKKRNYKLPKKVTSVNGRGLYIINECFDDIRWSSKGNRLQLALKR